MQTRFYYTPNTEIEAYRKFPALNASKLKLLENGLDRYKEKEDVELSSDSILIGSIVDTILTSPEGSFEERYIVLEENIEIPTEKKLDIVNKVFELVKEKDGDNINSEMILYEDIIIDVLNNTDWYANRKLETRLTDVLNSSSYFKFLVESDGKTIVPKKIYTKAMAVVDSLRANEQTAKYFVESAMSDKFKILYQVVIYFEIVNPYTNRVTNAKALLDFVVLDTEAKIIYIGDLKTTSGSCIEFKNSLLKYRYDLQSAFYRDAFIYVLTHNIPVCGIDLKDYTLAPYFTFIVESTTYPGNPVIYKADETVYAAGKYGRKSPEGKHVFSKGFQELVDEYEYLVDIGFTRDKIVDENNGILTLSV